MSASATLLLVFVLAKLVILWGHTGPINGWSVIAYVWQDGAVALAFGLFEIALRKLGATRIVWAVYGAIVAYTALNIPVGRAVSTPLTRPMLRAARGPLADSIQAYVTSTNIFLVLFVLAAAAGLPRLMRGERRWIAGLAVACAMVTIALGPIATGRTDTRGMDRNVITALVGPGSPRAAPNPISQRPESRFDAQETVDLSRFRGAAKGLNVVMISLESTAAQYLSLYGGEYDVMPNLSALARRALVFDNAYAVYPESIKGLYSVLCSTFPAFDSQPEQYGI
jgi:glucan phosphoethanolaminetransferase (alkaline phosphatase superfamily)